MALKRKTAKKKARSICHNDESIVSEEFDEADPHLAEDQAEDQKEETESSGQRSLQFYFKEVAKYKHLPPKEVIVLIKELRYVNLTNEVKALLSSFYKQDLADRFETGVAKEILERLQRNEIDPLHGMAEVYPELEEPQEEWTEAMLALIGMARSRSRAALEKLMLHNQRLVISIAKRYNKLGNLMDRIQSGNLGLQKGLHRFDPARGFALSTYVSWWIRHAIERERMDNESNIRLPVHVHEKINKLDQYSKQMKRVGAGIDLDASPKFLKGQTVREFTLEVLNLNQPLSLDCPISNDTDRGSYYAFIEDDSVQGSFQKIEDFGSSSPEAPRQMIEDLITASQLKPIEADIIRKRFGLAGKELTLRQIGDHCGLSKEGIRQIQKRALSKLRRAAKKLRFASPGL